VYYSGCLSLSVLCRGCLSLSVLQWLPVSECTVWFTVCVAGVGEVEPMDSEDEASDVEMTSMMVTVGTDSIPFSEVTEDMVARMTASEKAEYIRVGQQLYDQFNH